MASLRLKFPEKEEPSMIVLSGSRVTLGRLPLNTIQIIDRTLSGFHAEFVLEDDHFRLHDRGSTNGTFVNGESVTDFHLREACKISFGTLECEFSPEALAPAEHSNVEALPTRSEINAVRQENAELKNRAESLREELETLRKIRSTDTGTNTVAVAQEEYDKLLAEREQLKQSQNALQQEVTRLKTDLSILERDRENLQKAAATPQTEFASFRDEPKPVETPAAAAITPAPVIEKEEPPKVEAAPPPMPVAPAAPAPAAAPLPKPSFPLPGGVKAAPKPPGLLPTATARVPMPASPGLRPIPAAAPAQPAATPVNPPTVQLPKPPLKPMVRAQAPVAKGGTQRIDTEAAPTVKPVPPAGTLPMKPPVKLPLQPTVKLQPSTLPRPTLRVDTGSGKAAESESGGE